jgi:hypothetical protein
MTRLAMAAAGIAAAASGCQNQLGERYHNLVDPCWPDRYNHTARLETLQPFQSQAVNGHTLEQTVWNYHFEAGTDVLSIAGLQTLDLIVKRRPSPDGRVYLQTARDIAYDATAPEKLADGRRDLDERRAKAVQKYLAAQTAARPMTFEVQVIDPSDPAISARYPGNAIQQLVGQYQATLGGGVGGGAGGGGGGGAR